MEIQTVTFVPAVKVHLICGEGKTDGVMKRCLGERGKVGEMAEDSWTLMDY